MGLNITKGEWSKNHDPEYPEEISIECDAGTDNRYFIATVDFGMDQEANADLIIEAGTVANETGLTPRQLLDQRNELIGVLDELANGYEGCMWDTGLVPRLEKARLLIKKIKGSAK